MSKRRWLQFTLRTLLVLMVLVSLEMGWLALQLKKLQDNLGDFNDLCIQQEELRQHLQRGDRGDGSSTLEAAALGGLISMLYGKQRSVLSAVWETFRVVSAPENQRVFRQLFGSDQ